MTNNEIKKKLMVICDLEKKGLYRVFWGFFGFFFFNRLMVLASLNEGGKLLHTFAAVTQKDLQLHLCLVKCA